MDLKRILAPTDFSPASRPALDYALGLAQRFGARVDLMHVWELPIDVLPDWIVQAPGDPPQAITTLVRGRASQQMESLVTELRHRFDNVHGRLETGDPGQQIVEVSSRDPYDLIVMGTHGRRGLSHLWTGSVAERVVRRAICPVLTVHTAEKQHG
jgi:nucleotide-binding universal stress UspA family protein